MSDHTPLPPGPIVLPISVNKGLGGLYLRDGDDHGFAMTQSETHREKLEHVARACNLFPELVAELGTVREALFNLAPIYRTRKHFGQYKPGPDCPCSICVIDEVLAKARGEQL